MTTSFMSAPSMLFTSESVTEGHPDKMCDQISDAVLDALLEQDPMARVACETAIKTGFVLLAGEITTTAFVDFDKLVRQVVIDIGFDDSSKGFDGNTCGVIAAIGAQSPDIAQGVNQSLDSGRNGDSDTEVDSIGAGDQGMMFGYACNETDVLMPLPIYLAHGLTRRLAEARRDGTLPWARPDGKAQVTVEYRFGKPHRIHTVLVSSQHSSDVKDSTIIEGIIEDVIKPVLPADLVDYRDVVINPRKASDTTDTGLNIYINPTGRFEVGGPMGDAGVTGRKIIVDTYGGMGRHGGGAFSGKDATKVDRSAAYAARWVAKNLVAAGLAERCEVQVAYAIGVAHPLSINVETFGTSPYTTEQLVDLINEHFDLRPGAIIRDLNLRRPIYRKTAAYGHFGRDDIEAPWENTDRAEALRQSAEKLAAPVA